MTGLKNKIKQQELVIRAHKNNLHEQFDQLKCKIQKRMVSPLGLTSAFLGGVLLVYLIMPKKISSKKRIKKAHSDYLSVLNRLVAHISLLLSLRRLFFML